VLATRVHGFEHIATNELTYLQALYGDLETAKNDIRMPGAMTGDGDEWSLLGAIGPLFGRATGAMTLCHHTVFKLSQPIRQLPKAPKAFESVWGYVFREGESRFFSCCSTVC
jgi:hypothetical protein